MSEHRPPTSTAVAPGIAAGARLGSYQLEAQIGEGGMAAVFAARHVALGKRVAIKLLLPHAAQNADVARRFTREGEAAARLRHPNVVDVTDVGQTDAGQPFLVMEFLEGESLAAYLARVGRLSAQSAADLLAPIAAGLLAAHEAGIVHRDLKPDNIFLCLRRGSLQPKLVDFGISKRFGSESLAMTSSSALLGTPYYMSPEHVNGAGSVDARADQFALGVILYECVTGKRPFGGDTLYAVLAAILHTEPAAPSVSAQQVPPLFDELVMRLLKKDASLRYPSMSDAGRVLLEFASARVRLSLVDEFVPDTSERPAAAAQSDGLAVTTPEPVAAAAAPTPPSTLSPASLAPERPHADGASGDGEPDDEPVHLPRNSRVPALIVALIAAGGLAGVLAAAGPVAVPDAPPASPLMPDAQTEAAPAQPTGSGGAVLDPRAADAGPPKREAAASPPSQAPRGGTGEARRPRSARAAAPVPSVPAPAPRDSAPRPDAPRFGANRAPILR